MQEQTFQTRLNEESSRRSGVPQAEMEPGGAGLQKQEQNKREFDLCPGRNEEARSKGSGVHEPSFSGDSQPLVMKCSHPQSFAPREIPEETHILPEQWSPSPAPFFTF